MVRRKVDDREQEKATLKHTPILQPAKGASAESLHALAILQRFQ